MKYQYGIVFSWNGCSDYVKEYMCTSRLKRGLLVRKIIPTERNDTKKKKKKKNIEVRKENI